MRLSKYKVNKFRSVKGTEWIDVDQWTCLVGLNDSGKTNFLLPLWKFNPADDATQIDLLLDYPRDEYSEIEEKGRTSASSIAWGVAGGAVAGFISPVRSFGAAARGTFGFFAGAFISTGYFGVGL
jgi:hypothetical protein